MTETVRLFDRWKAYNRFQTDSEAARRLGVGRQAVSHWRIRGSVADAATLSRMCRDLGEDFGDVLARVAGEQMRSRAA
jgi:transcriptional regulator with XRE-family HTH domain